MNQRIFLRIRKKPIKQLFSFDADINFATGTGETSQAITSLTIFTSLTISLFDYFNFFDYFLFFRYLHFFKFTSLKIFHVGHLIGHLVNLHDQHHNLSYIISMSIINRQSLIGKVYTRYLHSPGSHQSTRLLESLSQSVTLVL